MPFTNHPLFVKHSREIHVAVYLSSRAGEYMVAFFKGDPLCLDQATAIDKPVLTHVLPFKGPLTEENIDALIARATRSLFSRHSWLPREDSYDAGVLIGQRLPNGATVIDVRYPPHPEDRCFCLVLADKGHGLHPWVVWVARADGSCSAGTYHKTCLEAGQALQERYKRLPSPSPLRRMDTQ